MNKDQKAKLKLSDTITVKKILSDKLHRELQGFRTNPNQYKELESVNPKDIVRIIREIKLKLGQ